MQTYSGDDELMQLLQRYNQFYNDEVASMPHGMPCSMEHLQSIAIRAMVEAFARKYNLKDAIPVDEMLELAEQIEKQGDETVKTISRTNDG